MENEPFNPLNKPFDPYIFDTLFDDDDDDKTEIDEPPAPPILDMYDAYIQGIVN